MFTFRVIEQHPRLLWTPTGWVINWSAHLGTIRIDRKYDMADQTMAESMRPTL